MIDRRAALVTAMGLAASVSIPGAAAGLPRPSGNSGMNHRRYTGKVAYITEGKGETGREFFNVTIQPDGYRTLRAMCELDDDQLLRDVVMSVDRDWHPTVSFVQIIRNQKFQGASWYSFTDHLAECEGLTNAEGRVSQRFPLAGPAEGFGTHPIHSDSWSLARIRKAKGDYSQIQIGAFATSLASNGGTGPTLMPVPRGLAKFDYFGRETVTVPAGTFASEHYRFSFPNDVLDIWAAGEDCLPIRSSSSSLKQHYELVELAGDYRS
jgi:hypothetical protein